MKDKKIFRKLYFLLMLIFLFEPNIFVKYSTINYIFIAGAALSFISAIIISFMNNIKIKSYLIFCILWRILALTTTIVNSGDILKCGYQTIILLSLLLYAEYFYKKNQFENFLHKLNKIFNLYLFINLITYIMFPSGIYMGANNLFFLGIRTRFTEYAFAGTLIAISCYKLKIISIGSMLFTIIVSFLNIFLPNVSTSYVGIAVIFLAYMFFKKIFFKKSNVAFSQIMLVGSILLTISIVFFRIQNIFSFFIEDILNKNLTLTGRTHIWDNSFEIIKSSNYILGNGYLNDGNFIIYGRGLWQAHNQLLQLIYEVGILGAYFFYKFLGKLISKTESNSKFTILTLSFALAILIMMITEIYAYYLPTFMIFLIVYYRETIEKLSSQKEEEKR